MLQLNKIKSTGNDDSIGITILNKADFNDMKNKLSNEHTNTGFEKCDADFLIDYIIKTHHVFAKKNSVIIYDLTQKVAYRHSHQREELKKFNEIAFLFFHGLLNQMLREEQSLFPFIRQIIKDRKYPGKKDDDISRTLEEKIKLEQNKHEEVFKYLKSFREITKDYEIPADACNHYKSLFQKMKELEHDLILHFHLEANILFRKVTIADKEIKQKAKLNESMYKPKYNSL
jgi:regulator of cell morphogenesis and NO signaling